MKKLVLLFGIVALMACCTEDCDDLKPIKRRDIELTDYEKMMSEMSINYSFNLFHKVHFVESYKKNWMFSPLSLSYSLSMLANGAEGNTLSQIKDVLEYDGAEMAEINVYNRKLIKELCTLDNTVTFGSANSIWANKDIELLEDFKSVCDIYYDADVFNIEEDMTEMPNMINKWCADKTNNYISKVLDEDVLGYSLLLINALYFNGKWAVDFKMPKLGGTEPFYNIDGTITAVKMMNAEDKMWYGGNDVMEMVEIPYGNGAFSMVIIIPKTGESIDDVVFNLNNVVWSDFKNNPQYGGYCNVKLTMPTFDVQYSLDFNYFLSSLGMDDVFDVEKADFSKLSNPSLPISRIWQHLYLSVNEKGSSAASTTLIGMIGSNGFDNTVTEKIVVDRPFVFIIKEKSTDVFLFMGKVVRL